MEQLFFILVFGLIALVRWLIESGKLKKIFGDFNSDLNNQNDGKFTNPNTPTFPRQTPPPRPASNLSPEEVRVRKFMEALGLPSDSAPPSPVQSTPSPVSPQSRPSRIPPILAESPIADRVRAEKEGLQRRLAEKRRVYERNLARVPKAPQRPAPVLPVPMEADSKESVEDYFNLQNSNQPDLEAIPEMAPLSFELGQLDGNQILEKKATSSQALDRVFGQGTDLRRLILAQEIFGKPKSLQNP